MAIKDLSLIKKLLAVDNVNIQLNSLYACKNAGLEGYKLIIHVFRMRIYNCLTSLLSVSRFFSFSLFQS